MAYASTPELLALHGVRIQGMSDAGSIARRFGVDRSVIEELLLDHEARGWVQRVGFADLSGWSLTVAGRAEDNRLLAAELDETGVRETIADAHGAFLGHNDRFLALITSWQIRPTRLDAMASNDHTDWAWDEEILKSLATISRTLRPIGDRLEQALARFGGYPQRFATALDHVDRGQRKWIDEPRMDSCHTVWFELHEDLLATLGLERGRGA